MNIFKKIFAAALIMTFCPMQAVFAADDLEEKIIKNTDVFENNYQSLKETSSKALSPTERMFNKEEAIISGNLLRQQGYNFHVAAGSNPSSTGKYGSNYKLGLGEKVNIYSFGDSVDVSAMSGNNLLMPSSQTEVGSDGTIYINGIGPVKAENRTLGQVESEANRIAQSKYQNLKIKLSVASGTEFSVFVYGEVNRPGKVYVGNNTSVLDVLSMAGGVKKTGTLRNIKYNSTDVDLYKTLFSANGSHILVKPNDVIFVDKIGEVVAVKNGVQVPGIYEIKEGETIKNLVAFAGGFLPTTEYSDITLIGFDEIQGQKAARNIPWSKYKTTKLATGDTIEFKELYNGVENTVTIQGNIKHPATVAYKKGMRLSDLLKGENELLEETFIMQASIRRISGKDNQVTTIPILLEDFFSGKTDPVLEPQDVVSIYRSTNSAFVDVIGCINTPKHMPYMTNMTLNDVLSDVKFVDTSVKNQNTNTSTTVFNTEETDENIKPVSETTNSNVTIPTDSIAVEITNKAGSTRIFYLYDIMINSDNIKSIKIAPEDKIFFRTLRGNEIIKKVKVSGFVNTPGVYSFVKGKNLVDMIEMAGGLTEDADLRGIVFKRKNIQGKQAKLAQENNERDIQLLIGRLAAGYKQDSGSQEQKLNMISQLKSEESTVGNRYSGQIALNIENNDLSKISELDNIAVQDGDDIYIPRISNHVSIIGEVYNEQSFMYKKGARAKYYIKEVGGYTPNANKFRIYKVGVNGKAEKIGKRAKVEPGDTIIIPRRIAGNDWITPITQTLQGLASVFIMVFGISKW